MGREVLFWACPLVGRAKSPPCEGTPKKRIWNRSLVSITLSLCRRITHQKQKAPDFSPGPGYFCRSSSLEPEHQVEAEVAEAAFEFFVGFDVADFDAIGVRVVKLEVFVEEVDKAVVVGDSEVDRANAF